MICFVIAMDKEAEPVSEAFREKSETVICGKRVICGILFNFEAAVVVCGVGKVNAACGAQIAIDKLGADKIVNFGVAGALKKDMEVGGVYSVSAAVQYDFDLTQLNGTEIGTLDECKQNYLPLTCGARYEHKKIGTGDRFNDSPADFALLTKTLGAEIRDMECAAVAQACMHAGVKCFAYKIISDVAGSGSTTEQYLKNLGLCFSAARREIQNIVREVNLL